MMIDFYLDWSGLATSFYVTLSLLWLGTMVLLTGNRKSPGAWFTGGGMLIGALFFTSHTAILGRGLSTTGFGMDFWWWVSWAPAVAAPFTWYCAIYWYARPRFDRSNPEWIGLVISGGLALAVIFQLIFVNPLPAYRNLVVRSMVTTPTIFNLPSLIFTYIIFCLSCFLLPIILVRKPFSPTQTSFPISTNSITRTQARLWLVFASICLMAAGLVMMWAALWVLNSRPFPSLTSLSDTRIVKIFDLSVQILVGLAITLLGRAIVGYEVFTAKPLPRSSFFTHWRATVLFAAGFSGLISWSIIIDLRAIYSLMLTVLLMTLFYALYSWRSIIERELVVDRLRPFLVSHQVFSRLSGDLRFSSQTGQQMDPGTKSATKTFFNLCHEILNSSFAVLLPSGTTAMLAGPPIFYPSIHPDFCRLGTFEIYETMLMDRIQAGKPGYESFVHSIGSLLVWVVPLWNERSLSGILLLGVPCGKSTYTQEEIETAQIGAGSILDNQAGIELASLSMDLLRQRLAQVRVLEGQGRRILHDEILPSLHTAVLLLSSASTSSPEMLQAVEVLSGAHHQISDLIRSSPVGVQNRIQNIGLAAALRGLLENEFKAEFTQADIEIEPDSVGMVRNLPDFISEVIYYACRELVRNAAVHGRHNREEPLSITLQVKRVNNLLIFCVEDNGKGIKTGDLAATEHPVSQLDTPLEGAPPGAGYGLKFHSAMLAAIGARLEIIPKPQPGTKAVISIPMEAARQAAWLHG